jgi:hypothetical protein
LHHVCAKSLGAAGGDQAPRLLPPEEDEIMNFLWAIAVVFFVLWLLGFAAFHVTSGLIHVLLVLALVTVVLRLLGSRTA